MVSTRKKKDRLKSILKKVKKKSCKGLNKEHSGRIRK